MVGSGLQPDFEYDYKCFCGVMHFLCDRAVLGYPRRHAAFPVRRHAFLLMFCVTRPTDLDRHKT